MAKTEHPRETVEAWRKAEQRAKSRKAYSGLIMIRSTIDRGDTATAEALAELLPEIVRENLPNNAELLHRVEKIYS